MIKNRSVPTNIQIAHLVYENPAQAIEWLTKTFGFVEHFRYGPPDEPEGAQMHLGDAWIMLRSVRPGMGTPAQLGGATQSVMIFVEDVDQHFKRSKAAGATIVEELHITEYGERQYAVDDLDQHRWVFSRHDRDVDPREWGAHVASS